MNNGQIVDGYILCVQITNNRHDDDKKSNHSELITSANQRGEK